jgi:hypothetical protein
MGLLPCKAEKYIIMDFISPFSTLIPMFFDLCSVLEARFLYAYSRQMEATYFSTKPLLCHFLVVEWLSFLIFNFLIYKTGNLISS